MLKMIKFWWIKVVTVIDNELLKYTNVACERKRTSQRVLRSGDGGCCCTCLPLQNLSQNYVVDTWHGKDKASHACLVKRTPPLANRKNESGVYDFSWSETSGGPRRRRKYK